MNETDIARVIAGIDDSYNQEQEEGLKTWWSMVSWYLVLALDMYAFAYVVEKKFCLHLISSARASNYSVERMHSCESMRQGINCSAAIPNPNLQFEESSGEETNVDVGVVVRIANVLQSCQR